LISQSGELFGHRSRAINAEDEIDLLARCVSVSVSVAIAIAIAIAVAVAIAIAISVTVAVSTATGAKRTGAVTSRCDEGEGSHQNERR